MKRFRIALSFPGEHRSRIERIAETLASHLGHEQVLYDKWHSADFNRPNLDIYLARLYHEESDLIAVFLCKEYNVKTWCGLEWRACRDLLKHRQDNQLMFFRLDDADIPGLYSIDGYQDMHKMTNSEVVSSILIRLGQVSDTSSPEEGPSNLQARAQQGKEITRRSVLSLGSGLVGFLLGVGLANVRGALSTPSKLWVALLDPAQRSLDTSRSDWRARVRLLAKLLRITGSAHIVPPTGHPLYHRPGPHDLAVMKIIGSLFDDPQAEPSMFSEKLRTTDTLFCTGSPVSSVLAATFVPTSGQITHKDFPLLVDRKTIPYHFFHGESDDLVLKSATDGGRQRPARNNGLTVDGETWHPQPLADKGGWLKTDFLLLTVLPWSKAGGGYAAFVSGGHGAGTRAFELLLKPDTFPLESFERLMADLGNARGYQVVFEVTVIHTGAYSMPSAIRVSTDCPPRRIESIKSLFAFPDTQIDAIVSAAIRKNEETATGSSKR